MIVNEDLQYAIIEKYSYGWPNIYELRRILPRQYELKSEYSIGYLSNRYILIQASCIEDYVHLLSKPIFYIEHKNWNYLMKTLKWDPLFDPKEETAIAIAKILFPALPPNVFGK